MSQLLPSTLTPLDINLTPETQSLITKPDHTWGRLFPTLQCLSAYDLHRPTFKLGKNDDCDCVLTNETFIRNKLDNISREHFVICKDPGKPVYIQDLSKNGTFLNGDKIGRKNRRILQNDDEISIGFQGLKVFIYKNIESGVDDFLPSSLQKKYYVSRFLGKGACGEVKLIFDKRTCRPYAIKRIIKARSSKKYDMNHSNAIRKEINILQELVNHPFIVSIYGIEETPRSFFITMEYLEGGQLTDLILSSPLAEKQVKYFFYQIVMAVQYLHDNGIIHRDLKADNILLKEKDNLNTIVKVSDFGLSKILTDESRANTKCGTPYYIAPEIINAANNFYDRKVDIWSLGVLLYFMLSQELPFKSTDSKILNTLIISGKYEMDNLIWENISAEAKNLIRRMLTVSPENRINLEEIPDHPWIATDPWTQKKVDDLVYGMAATYTFELDETIIGPEAKRMRYSQDD